MNEEGRVEATGAYANGLPTGTWRLAREHGEYLECTFAEGKLASYRVGDDEPSTDFDDGNIAYECRQKPRPDRPKMRCHGAYTRGAPPPAIDCP